LSNVLFIAVFLPLVMGFVLLFVPAGMKLMIKTLALFISVIEFALGIWIFRLDGYFYQQSVLQIGDFNLELLLRVQPLGAFMLLFAMGFGLLICLYSLRAMADGKNPNVFYGALLITMGGSAGILLSDHLLFLLIFWEIVTTSLYLLITTGGKNSEFAATKSFAMIGASDGALLLGIGMVWVLSGHFLISGISAARLGTDSALSIIAFLLLVTAAITKAGAMPLHSWLPTSGEYAPATVMALLPAAIDKLLGIYLLVVTVRSLFVVSSAGLQFVLALIGAGTILIAVMIAMVQHNLKRLLSYHAISQVGYMVLGIATGTAVGIAGGVFHMLNNAIYKCCLFLCGGAAEKQAGTPQLDALGGLGKKMPITFAACLVAALSISGIPPFNGFVSKWMVYQGVIEMGSEHANAAANWWPVWLVAAMFGSALTLASFVKLLHSVFLSRLPDELKEVKEAPVSMLIPMVILAVLCVFFGVFYHVPLKMFIYPALNMEATDPIFGTWQSELATVMIVLGILIGLGIVLLSLLQKKVRVVPTWTCGEIQPNEQMIIPGTDFYKTVSSMQGLRQLYNAQEKDCFEPYKWSGKTGLALTEFLRWMHCGVLPVYLTWVTFGLLLILFIVCSIW